MNHCWRQYVGILSLGTSRLLFFVNGKPPTGCQTTLEFFTIKNNITPYGMKRISEWSSILLISHCSQFSQKGKMALSFISLCVHRRYLLMLFLMVPQEGLEPSPEDWLLRPACLPIPPPGQLTTLNF